MPSLLWVEVLNVLHRRHHWGAAAIVEGFLALDGLELHTVEVDRPLLLLAADRKEAFGLSAYGPVPGLGLRVARLATLDERLARTAGPRAIPVGGGAPRRLAEPTAPDPDRGREPPWARSALVGAHISEMRRQALGGRDV